MFLDFRHWKQMGLQILSNHKKLLVSNAKDKSKIDLIFVEQIRGCKAFWMGTHNASCSILYNITLYRP